MLRGQISMKNICPFKILREDWTLYKNPSANDGFSRVIILADVRSLNNLIILYTLMVRLLLFLALTGVKLLTDSDLCLLFEISFT